MNPHDVVEVISNRANPGIDPHLHVWGWEIPGYLFLGGVVAGLLVLLAALELTRKRRPTSGAAQWMPLVAIVLLSLGMGLLFLDLANKEHVYRFYTTFQPTSPMSWGSWILLLVYPALVLLFLSGLDEQRRDALVAWKPVARLRLARLLRWAMAFGDRHRRGVVWLSLLAGVGLGAYTGLLLGTMAARPTWNSGVMGPLFLTSGISTGAAVMLLTRLDPDETAALVRWDIMAIAVELVLLTMLLLGLSSGGTNAQAAASGFLGGAYTASFWSLVVMAGLVVPLILNVLEVKRHTRMTLFAPALVLIGGLALRAIFVAAGQAHVVGVLH
ncbi:MAG: polysulfide reductase NrfD [Myxococcales bacterium]|nr:polysulfide reductase NrfD [Myxococcales bacterium]MCB9735049.1 polysulfide reductase NrfD [Deltaproteobacteria bacterium]